MSVDTLLNWADIGTKAHTSERLTSLLRQMPIRLGGALACLVKSNENSEATEEMEKIATHGSIQKSTMDAMVKKIAMDVSCQRMTNTVGNTVPQRLSIELLQQSRQMWNGLFTSTIVKTAQSVDFFPFQFLNTVWCSIVLVMRVRAWSCTPVNLS